MLVWVCIRPYARDLCLIGVAVGLLGAFERGWSGSSRNTECFKREFAVASFFNCGARLDVSQPRWRKRIFSFRRARDACPCRLIRRNFREKSGSASSKMTLEEKVGQLVQYSAGQPTGPGTGRTDYEE